MLKLIIPVCSGVTYMEARAAAVSGLQGGAAARESTIDRKNKNKMAKDLI